MRERTCEAPHSGFASPVSTPSKESYSDLVEMVDQDNAAANATCSVVFAVHGFNPHAHEFRPFRVTDGAGTRQQVLLSACYSLGAACTVISNQSEASCLYPKHMHAFLLPRQQCTLASRLLHVLKMILKHLWLSYVPWLKQSTRCAIEYTRNMGSTGFPDGIMSAPSQNDIVAWIDDVT
jgi:hypothetical protein